MKQVASRAMAIYCSEILVDFQRCTRLDITGNRTPDSDGQEKGPGMGTYENCVGPLGSANAAKFVD
jgi:hypothetical protein